MDVSQLGRKRDVPLATTEQRLRAALVRISDACTAASNVNGIDGGTWLVFTELARQAKQASEAP